MVSLTFASGKTVRARIDEDFVCALMYHDKDTVCISHLAKRCASVLMLHLLSVAAKLLLKVSTALSMCIKRMVASQMKCSLTATGVCHTLFLTATGVCPATMRVIAQLNTEGDDSDDSRRH